MTAGKYTLAALIAFANDEGLLINNLFQLDDGALVKLSPGKGSRMMDLVRQCQ